MGKMELLLDFIFPPRPTEKIVRGVTSADLADCLFPTFFETPHQENITFLLPYHEEVVRALILETKYHGNKKTTNLLGEILSDFLIEYIEEENAFSATSFVLVPVPLSKKRGRARGYNQAEELCKAALRIAPQLVLQSECLTRTRDTEPQTSLSSTKRRFNIEGAFQARDINPDHTYICIDDVVTTGSTLLAGMRTLKKAGAKNVIGLALAH